MLNADKYIDRLRVIVKSNYEMKNNKSNKSRLEFMAYRVLSVIKDYDEDFDKAMHEMEMETYNGQSYSSRQHEIKMKGQE